MISDEMKSLIETINSYSISLKTWEHSESEHRTKEKNAKRDADTAEKYANEYREKLKDRLQKLHEMLEAEGFCKKVIMQAEATVKTEGKEPQQWLADSLGRVG